MNEQIRELAKQAGAYWNHGDFNMGSSVEFQEGDLEKFAELIVRKCADACAQQALQTAMFSSGQATRAAYACERAIKQQFGVDA